MGVAVAVEAFYRHEVLGHSARKTTETTPTAAVVAYRLLYLSGTFTRNYA